MKRFNFWPWFWIVLGGIYFFLPLYATLDYSLRGKKDVLSFAAYENVLNDPQFLETFGFSLQMAILTIIVSTLIVVPTAYWVNLRLRYLRPLVEFVTLMPFVVPTIILVFGLIRIYSRPPLSLTETESGTNLILIGAYAVLSFPYMYRAVDSGLRAIDVRGLADDSVPRYLPKCARRDLERRVSDVCHRHRRVYTGDVSRAPCVWPVYVASGTE